MAAGADPERVTQAVVACWRDGEVTGLQVDDLGLEEARSLTRPAMTHVRGQLRGRLTARRRLDGHLGTDLALHPRARELLGCGTSAQAGGCSEL